MPNHVRSRCSACSTQEDPVWSKSAQKTATKTKMIINLAMAKSPSGESVSLKKVCPCGGMCTKTWRPIQKSSVARAMSTPGIPKAQWGPYHSSNHGVSKVESAAPTLMEI